MAEHKFEVILHLEDAATKEGKVIQINADRIFETAGDIVFYANNRQIANVSCGSWVMWRLVDV